MTNAALESLGYVGWCFGVTYSISERQFLESIVVYLVRQNVCSITICAFLDIHETTDMILEWEPEDEIEHSKRLEMPRFDITGIKAVSCKKGAHYKTGESK